MAMFSFAYHRRVEWLPPRLLATEPRHLHARPGQRKGALLQDGVSVISLGNGPSGAEIATSLFKYEQSFTFPIVDANSF